MAHHSACLLLLSLLLTCLADLSASETEQRRTVRGFSDGPSEVVINGVSTLTVGIAYDFQCLASNCYPSCQYRWTRGNVTSEGPDLHLHLLHIEPAQTLTCTAVNPTSGKNLTVQKTLPVTVGPSNIQISGPPTLTIGAASVYTCSAECYPSCIYSWRVFLDEAQYSTAEGNTISVTPPLSTVTSETLICEAKNNVSGLFISTTQLLYVASIKDISIVGDSTVTMGQTYKFICQVTCTPTCTIKWKYMGKTFVGDQIQITVFRQGEEKQFASHMEITITDLSKVEPLTCEVTNPGLNATLTTTKNLSVFDPISVHPTSQALPVAGKVFSLQCAGSHNPDSIIWLKDKRPLPASERLRFSSDNTTMTFSPLLQADDGSYQCVVAEAGVTIQSVGYQMQVVYGPKNVIISGPGALEIGVTASFTCSAECSPACSFTWTLYGNTVTGSAIDITVSRHVSREALSCQAHNTMTRKTATVNETLSVSDPHWCGC